MYPLIGEKMVLISCGLSTTDLAGLPPAGMGLNVTITILD